MPLYVKAHFGPNEPEKITVNEYELFLNVFSQLTDYGLATGQKEIHGGAGNDGLFGGDDVDLIFGDDDDDGIAGNGGNDILIGGDGNDTILGGYGNDLMSGGTGIDIVYGEYGNDVMSGGSGDDTLVGDSDVSHTKWNLHGDDIIEGDAGNDYIFGNGANDILRGGEGNDSIWGDGDNTPAAYHGIDQLYGGLGNDILWGNGSDDLLFGDEGDDTFFGGDGNDELVGGLGIDSMQGEAGDDHLDGGAGNDILDGGDDNDVLLGGDGTDQLQAGNGDDTLDGGNGDDAMLGGDGNDTMLGGSGIDNMVGEAGNDDIDGGADNDTIWGDQGNDTLRGGSGDNLLDGGDGDDTLISGGGNDLLKGGAGNDTYEIGSGNAQIIDLEGTNTIRFGAGATRNSLTVREAVDATSPELKYQVIGSGNGGQVFIKNGFLAGAVENFLLADGTTLSREQIMDFATALNLTGTDGDDRMVGSGQSDVLSGGNGNENMMGGGGADTLSGDAGDDRISGGTGNDNVNGGTGADMLFGDAGDDQLLGGSGNDTLTGGAGSDMLDGGVDDDVLDGGDGADTLIGGAGNDQMTGGIGNDTVTGGDGSDTYYFARGAGQDLIIESDSSPTLADVDVVQFASDIAVTDVTATRVVQDLVLNINGTTDSVRIQDYFARTDNFYKVEQIKFADGTIWTNSIIQSKVNAGTALADTIYGTSANNTIDGLAGDDYISGGDGNDVLYGSAGNDTLLGDNGFDILFGGTDNDLLVGGAGGDSLIGDSGNDILRGGDDNDSLSGGNDSDMLYGEAGSDQLSGGDGNDTLDGGTGDDSLYGGLGNDTYLFAKGTGYETLTEQDVSGTASTDIIVMGADIAVSDIQLVRSTDNYNDLELRLRSTGDTLRVNGYFARQDNQQKIEEIRSGDNTVWDIQKIKNRVEYRSVGADTIIGYAWDDVIDGLAGDDDLNGVAGNDQLFGSAGNDRLHGDIGNDILDGGADADTLYGDEGNDTLEGGSGNDILYGDQASGTVTGDDTLHGGAGRDLLYGGAGNDTYRFGRGDGNDRIIETSGIDKIKLEPGIVAANVTLFRNNFDLILALDAGATQLSVAGYFGADANAKIETIEFSDGAVWNQTTIQSLIVAGTANVMTGTASNDTFVVDNAGDTITEGLNQGIDTVQSSIGYTLPTNVENMTLTGYLNVDIAGNALDNTLLGNIGDNTLDGLAGSDTLKGDKGDDTYRVDSGDTVTELAGEGNDTVVYTGGGNSYTLTDNVENISVDELYGYNFTTTLTGNALDNVIDGSGGYIYRGGTILDGGLGADIMIGRSNVADTYYVDNVGDSVVEKNVGGTGTGDMVNSTISYVLAPEIENLTLLSNSAINGTGNASNNILDGLQNAAANTLSGGQGNDTYVVGANDLIVEAINEGDDLVKAYSSYALSNNLEKLWLYSGGIGTGNDQNNEIRNSSFSTPTVLDGRGGNDVLIGLGNSSDTYVFDRGYGADVAQNAPSGIVAFGPNTGAGDIRLAVQGPDLIISYLDTADTLTLRNYNFNEFRFADGTIWNSAAINQRLSTNNANVLSTGNDTYTGTTGNDSLDGQGGNDTISGGQGSDTVLDNDGDDTLFGNDGNDILKGGIGEDTLYGNAGDDDLDGGGGIGFDRLEGGTGSDTYQFGRGAGAVTVYEASGTRLETDRVLMAANVIPSDVAVTQSGDTLVLSINGTNDTMMIEGFFAQPLVDQDISRQGDDLIIWMTAKPDQTLTVPGYYLWPGRSSDPRADAVLTQSGDDLILGVANFPQTTRIVDFYYGTHQIEEVRFADNTVWTAAMLIDMTKIVNGTDAVDTLAGTVGNDRMYGFAGNDTLDGFEGNDTLDGGAGVDTMRGGAGDDRYIVDNTGDITTELANEGIDTVESSVARTLGANIENLTLTGAAAINATGNTLNNILIGNASNNLLSGGTGADSMTGGAGDDTYVVDNAGDTVIEAASEGTDLVQSGVTYALGANLENLTLTATTAVNATGNALDNIVTGGSGNNILDGGAGNDTLNGAAGTDTLKGGAGNDIYIVDSTTDVITELANDGIDTIQSSVTFTMAAAAYNNIENLTLTATTAINATGNALNNVLTGGSGNNILDGGAGNDTLNGAAGTDTLKGGAGNDNYIVDTTTDVITELANEGIDTVTSSVTYTTLGANIENLVLTGSAAINATGNTLNNTLIGNSNNNTLNGGTGIDTLQGGAGNDIYVVDSTTDIITELANEGTDTIQSSVTFTIAAAAYDNIENLTLTATTAINATGNALDNVLAGGSGNNILDGGAGNDTLNGAAGTDTLKGGTGNDIYIVDTATDTITELLNEGTDTIQSSIAFNLGGNAMWANIENLTIYRHHRRQRYRQRAG